MAIAWRIDVIARGRIALIPMLALLASACGGPDIEQVRACESLISALEAPGTRIEILDARAEPAAGPAVRVRYRAAVAPDSPGEHWIVCRYGGRGFEQDRLELTGVTTDRAGVLSETQLFMLRRFWLGFFEARARAGHDLEEPPRDSFVFGLLYLLQISVNAIAVSCVYGLLAVGYTLVFGMIGRINLAFGELAMLGAFATLIGVTLLALAGAAPLALALIAVLLVAMAVSGLYGWTTERVLFRPLRGARSQAALIATLGLAVFLQEFVHLTQGAGEHWLQRPFAEPHLLAETRGFGVSLTTAQLVILALTALLYGALYGLQRRTAFGRAQRACSDDPGMAALCGVDARRTIALTFALGGAYAGAAGLIMALYYGGVHFFMGYLIGFKALVAAVVGGIGSVPGALLGGLLIGLLETFWSGYLTIAYKDIAVFGLLTVFLVFRPHGLFGAARDPLD